MTTRTSAEIEAALDAFDAVVVNYAVQGNIMHFAPREKGLAAMAAALRAADAAAAPAVGVTVDFELDSRWQAQIDNYNIQYRKVAETFSCNGSSAMRKRTQAQRAFSNAAVSLGTFVALELARHGVVIGEAALLTAQPQPEQYTSRIGFFLSEDDYLAGGIEEPGTHDDAGQPAGGAVTG